MNRLARALPVARTQSVAALLAFIASLLALAVFLPLLVRLLGAEAYGAWVLTAGLINLLVVFDFGFYLTVARFVARDRWTNPAMAEQAITVAVVFLTAVGLLIALSAQVLAPRWQESVDVTGTGTALRYAGPAVLAVLLSKAIQGALEGANRVALSRTVQACSTIAFVGGSALVAAIAGADLVLLGQFALAESVAALLLFGALLAREWGRVPVRRPSRETSKAVVSYALGNQGAQAATLAVEPTSRILVGAVAGPAAVAPLDIALRARSAWFGAALAFLAPVLPRLGREAQSAREAAEKMNPVWNTFILVSVAAGAFTGTVAYFLAPALFGAAVGDEAALYALAAIIAWTPAVAVTLPYVFVVYYGRVLDLVVIQGIAAAIAIGLMVALVWFVGAWAPILGLGCGILVTAPITVSRARLRAGDPDSFRIERVTPGEMMRALFGTAAAAAMALPISVAITLPIALLLWISSMRRELLAVARAI